MNDKQNTQYLLKVLTKIKADGPFDIKDGICDNVRNIVRSYPDNNVVAILSLRTIMVDKFVVWPEYSGDYLFPVRHLDYDSPYVGYQSTRNMWEGEYGASRMRLLDFTIASLTEDLRGDCF